MDAPRLPTTAPAFLARALADAGGLVGRTGGPHRDQQELVDAVLRAGGAPAWFVVVETETRKTSSSPVSAEEIEGFLQATSQTD